MIQRLAVLPAGIVLWLFPHAALAHGVLTGAGDFYAGLLHPIVVPAEFLAITAAGLLLGASGPMASRRAIVALAAGAGAGVSLGLFFAPPEDATPLLLAVAFAAAGTVTAALRMPPWFVVGVAALTGIAVGIDAAPEAKAISANLSSGAATVLACAVLATIVAAVALRADRDWQRIAVRVAGSWITASAMLYFAFQIVSEHQ